MDEQLKNSLAELIDLVISGSEGLIEFSKAQIPEVLEQLIMFNTVWLTFLMVQALLVLPAVFKMFTWGTEKAMGSPNGSDGGGAGVMMCMLSVATGIFSFVLLFDNAREAFLIYIAPKVWLLEYAGGLVK